MNEPIENEIQPSPCECHVCEEVRYLEAYKPYDVLMLGVAAFIRKLCLSKNGIKV